MRAEDELPEGPRQHNRAPGFPGRPCAEFQVEVTICPALEFGDFAQGPKAPSMAVAETSMSDRARGSTESASRIRRNRSNDQDSDAILSCDCSRGRDRESGKGLGRENSGRRLPSRDRRPLSEIAWKRFRRGGLWIPSSSPNMRSYYQAKRFRRLPRPHDAKSVSSCVVRDSTG